MKLPSLRDYVSTKQTSLPGTSIDGKPRPGFQVADHNTLLHNYAGAIGIKDGYTVAAKFADIEAATRAGKTYFVTETARPDGGRPPAAAMLDWAFAHGPSVAPIGALVDLAILFSRSQPRRRGFVPGRYRPIRLVCRVSHLLSPLDRHGGRDRSAGPCRVLFTPQYLQ